ncbi:MAG: hypothetical protein ACREVI_01925 [Steroidobacteraceae bacterium]
MTTPTPEQRAGRRHLLLVALLFFAPLAFAAWIYFGSGWRPGGSVQHGELVEPPRPLPLTPLLMPDGGVIASDALRGSWFLVHLVEGECDDRCLDALAESRRLRLALGRNMSRVTRVLLHSGGCCSTDVQAGPGRDLLVLGAPGPEGAALRNLFPPAPGGGAGLYIVDPRGSLILSYPATGRSRGLLEDLERLLRLSNIG